MTNLREMVQLWKKRPSLWVEIAALFIILGAALFLRLWHLGVVPPGLHFDEAIDLKIGLDVANGSRPIYVAEGWGREGLYYYLVAIVLQFVPYNPIALRVSAVICGMGVLVVAYFLGRLWHSRLAAWFMVAWLGLTYWTVSASRFGVRHISLTFMLGVTVWVFWRAWQAEKQRWQHFAVAGFCLGLTMYTYQPARFVPFIFIAFIIYLFLCHRKMYWEKWRFFLLSFAIFAIMTLPLVVALRQHGTLETEQRAFTIEPITQLLAGNVKPIMANVVATLKVFTISGDPLKSYNVPDRPIFVPAWTGLFFYVGLVLAIWRWRQPLYAFLLLWLFFTLLPTVLTIAAPNFNRMVAAQVPIMFFAAFPMAELVQWVERHRKKGGVAVALLLGGVFFTPLTLATWHDYFEVWATTADITALNGAVSAVADYLEHDLDGRPVLISSRNIADEDPYVLSVSMDRADFAIRWVDTGQALAMPVGVDEVRLVVTAERWLDGSLGMLANVPAFSIHQQPEFSVFVVARGAWLNAGKTPLHYLTPDIFPPTSDNVGQLDWAYPYLFCDCELGENAGSGNLALTGLAINEMASNANNFEIMTTWQALEDHNFASLAIFGHLLNANGDIVAQFDGLGYPPHTWQSGDQFAQVIRLNLGEALPPDNYWFQLGLYDRETGKRWLLLNPDNISIADRVVLGSLIVSPEGVLHLEN